MEDKRKRTVLVVSMTRTAEDVRVSRHIRRLAEQFRVISVGYGHGPEFVDEHVEIPHGAKYLPISLASLPPHLVRLFSLSSALTPAISRVKRVIESLEFDIALLNDVQTLPLMDVIRVPVVVDMHEFAPREMEDDWRFRLLLMRYYGWLCTKYLPKACKVITVSKGLAREYSDNFGIDCEVVMNAREYCQMPVRSFDGPILKLVHTGLAARSRRLERMIEEIADDPLLALDMYLVAAPRQRRILEKLKRLASATSNVRVVDPVPSRDLPMTINAYDIALIFIPPSNLSLMHGMPNKLFDSLQARVGVVTGPSPDMVELGGKFGFLKSTNSFDKFSLRSLLHSLSASEINRMKVCADLASSELSSEKETLKLLEIVRSCSSDL